jgi:membrane-associated HD superfamily phosphohydrolase
MPITAIVSIVLFVAGGMAFAAYYEPKFYKPATPVLAFLAFMSLPGILVYTLGVQAGYESVKKFIPAEQTDAASAAATAGLDLRVALILCVVAIAYLVMLNQLADYRIKKEAGTTTTESKDSKP